MENLPILPAKNLAPLKPLFALKDGKTTTPTYITDGLRELLQDVLQRHKDTFKEIATVSEVTSNFIQGKQLWRQNYWNNTWTIQPTNLADVNRISSINIMQFYCTSQMKMITASNPDLEPEDEFKRSDMKEQIKIAKAVWNKYESRFYTPWFNNNEALHAIISGTYVEQVAYDHLKASTTVFKEVFETKNITLSEGGSICFSCGFEGKFEDFVPKEDAIPACPQCGSMQILPPEMPETQQFQSVAGLEPIVMGDLDLKLIPIQALRFDVSKRLEDSSWCLYRQHVPKSTLRYMLGGIELPAEDAVTDYGLNSLQSISRAGNTLAGHNSTTNNFRSIINQYDVIVDRLSVKPEDVAHIICKQDEETVSGETIKAGTKMSDLCPPEGMTILSINNGKHIIGLYPGIHHSQEMASGVYHLRMESGLGRGSEDTVEVQKRFLRLDAQNLRYLEASATPAHVYVKGSVDRQHIKKIGRPDAVIPINPEVAQAFGTLDVVKQLQPGTIAAQFFSYTYDILNQYRQLTSHSTDFTNAFPGVDNKTATGAKLAKANADSIFSPFLQLKSEVRRTIAHKTLKLYNKHFKGVKQYVPFGESTTGQMIGDMIDGADVDTRIKFAVVRDSEQPKTPLDRQLDLVNMMSVAANGGGIAEIKATDPKLYEALLRSFDIDIETNVYSTMADVCETRLKQALEMQSQVSQMQELAQMQGIDVMQQPMLQMPSDMLVTQVQPALKLEEPHHDKKAEWFMEYLDNPEGAKLTPEERDIVAAFVRAHVGLYMQQQAAMAQGFGMVQMAGQQPMMEAQMAQQDAQAQQQAQQQANEQAIEEQKIADERAYEEQKIADEQAYQEQQAIQQAELAEEQTMLDTAAQMALEEQRAMNAANTVV